MMNVSNKKCCLLLYCLLTACCIQAQFTLPLLPYPYDALEPAIDAATMQVHHGTHHKAYVANLNKALEGYPELQVKSVEALMAINHLPAAIQTAVRNNGGGHLNHTLFWELMRPPTDNNAPQQALKRAIDKQFGSFDAFKTAFEQAALSRFGSGWAWLLIDERGLLVIDSTPNQDNPLMDTVVRKGKPILALDVWEHAYYLKYQAQRKSYVAAFWSVVNWDKAAELYHAAVSKKE